MYKRQLSYDGVARDPGNSLTPPDTTNDLIVGNLLSAVETTLCNAIVGPISILINADTDGDLVADVDDLDDDNDGILDTDEGFSEAMATIEGPTSVVTSGVQHTATIGDGTGCESTVTATASGGALLIDSFGPSANRRIQIDERNAGNISLQFSRPLTNVQVYLSSIGRNGSGTDIFFGNFEIELESGAVITTCLLYTSDAADD